MPTRSRIHQRHTKTPKSKSHSQSRTKIVKKTNELSIQLESETVVASNFLRFNRFGSTLDAYVLTEEEHRRLFHKLAPIFKRRNLRLRTVLWAHNMLLLGVL